jgi:hypothetical protein
MFDRETRYNQIEAPQRSLLLGMLKIGNVPSLGFVKDGYLPAPKIFLDPPTYPKEPTFDQL